MNNLVYLKKGIFLSSILSKSSFLILALTSVFYAFVLLLMINCVITTDDRADEPFGFNWPKEPINTWGGQPYMGYIGMCRCEGYGFQAVYSRIGYINQSVWV